MGGEDSQNIEGIWSQAPPHARPAPRSPSRPLFLLCQRRLPLLREEPIQAQRKHHLLKAPLTSSLPAVNAVFVTLWKNGCNDLLGQPET